MFGVCCLFVVGCCGLLFVIDVCCGCCLLRLSASVVAWRWCCLWCVVVCCCYVLFVSPM